jgi:hypothetical protein
MLFFILSALECKSAMNKYLCVILQFVIVVEISHQFTTHKKTTPLRGFTLTKNGFIASYSARDV